MRLLFAFFMLLLCAVPALAWQVEMLPKGPPQIPGGDVQSLLGPINGLLGGLRDLLNGGLQAAFLEGVWRGATVTAIVAILFYVMFLKTEIKALQSK